MKGAPLFSPATLPEDLGFRMFYDPPFITVKRGRGTVRLPGSRTYSHGGRVCKSTQPLDCQGDFATLTKFQGVPTTKGATVDAHKGRKGAPEVGNSTDLALAWKYASSKAAWLKLSAKFGRMAAALTATDPEFASDLDLLKRVAFERSKET